MNGAFDSINSALRTVLPFEWAQLSFMLNALMIVAVIAPLCAALGVKVVNYRMAFFSDAISHSAFTGVVLGYLLVPVLARRHPGTDWSLVLPPVTLVVFGVMVGLGITAVRHRTDLSSDTVIGVFFATVIALGIAVISRFRLRGDFERYLYGYIVTATPTDVVIVAALALLVLLFFAAGFNQLMLIGLNESLSRSRGIATRVYEYVFAGLLALTVTFSIRTIGLLLVTAMLVVPAATARNLARSAGGMFWWAVAVGLVCGVGGLIASYYADTSAGATIILLAAFAFLLSMLVRGVGRPAGALRAE
jgi:zinc transport system permease protein